MSRLKDRIERIDKRLLSCISNDEKLKLKVERKALVWVLELYERS